MAPYTTQPMKSGRIYFRADADSTIGFGHFVRTLALAELLKDDFECVFFTAAPTRYQKDEVKKVCRLVELPGDDRKFDEFLSCLTGNEIVFLDNYFFGQDYEKKIKDIGSRLVVLSPPVPHHYADVVFNYLEKDFSKYSVEPYTRIYAGQEWTILRKPFLVPANGTKRKMNTVAISFGGTDPCHLTEKALEHLNGKEINIICTSRIDSERIRHFEEQGATVYKDVSSETVAEIFETSEFAILSSSTICMEALSRGCKVLAGHYVDNQVNYYKSISEQELIYPLGDLLAADAFENLDTKFEASRHTEPTRIDFTGQRDSYIKIFKLLC